MIWVGKYLICILYLLFMLGAASFLKKQFHVQDETSRKTVHIMLGGMWVLFYVLFWGSAHYYMAPFVSVLIAIAGVKFDFLTVLKREGADEYEPGVVLYMVSAFILAAFASFYPPALPSCLYGMMAIAFGDGTAALVGRKWGKYTPKLRNKKSLAGSFGCFFFATLAMVVVCLLLGFELNIWKFMVLALAATIVELFGDKYDNLLIGLTVAIIGTVLRV